MTNTTTFNATLYAIGDDNNRTNVLSAQIKAEDTAHLSVLIGKVVNFFELRASRAINAARVRNYKLTDGIKNLCSVKPRANQLFVEIAVLSEGVNWKFGTLENIPAPYTMSEKTFTKIAQNICISIFENVMSHAIEDSEATDLIVQRLQTVYGSNKGLLNKAETILRRKLEIIGVIRGYELSNFIAETQN